MSLARLIRFLGRPEPIKLNEEKTLFLDLFHFVFPDLGDLELKLVDFVYISVPMSPLPGALMPVSPDRVH